MAFAVCELITGIFGLASSSIISQNLTSSVVELVSKLGPNSSFELQQTLAYSSVFLLLLLPTMAIGATLPALADLSKRQIEKPSYYLSSLYLFNTLGAVAATLFSGLILLPWFGINLTLVIAASINILVSLFAFLLNKEINKNTVAAQFTMELDQNSESLYPDRVKNIIAMACVFVTGTTFMAMEVIWTRYLVVLFGSSTYCLSIVLANCLIGVSIGTLIVSKIPNLQKERVSVYGSLLFFATLSLSLCLHLYNCCPYLYLALVDFSANLLSLEDSLSRLISMIVTTSIMVLPSAICLGAVFPFALIDRGQSHTNLTKVTSQLLSSNIFGTIVGAYAVFILFERDLTHIIQSNIQTATFWLTMIILVLATILAATRLHFNKERSTSDWIIVCVILLSSGILILRPAWNPDLMTVGYSFIDKETIRSFGVTKTIQSLASNNSITDDSFYYREAANTIVAVKRDKNNNLTKLSNNGKVEAAIPISRRAPSPWSDLPTHTLMGLSASILCPNKAQDSLVIGYGSGTTCGTNLAANWLKSLTVIELDEAVYSVDPYFQPSNLTPLKSANLNTGKIKPVIADARSYLASSKSLFDTIISQPAEPWIAGSSNLYTKEFFDLASSKLKKKGIFCQWIQLYAISLYDFKVLLKTFNSSFKNTYVMHSKNAGEIILLGKNDSDKFSASSISRRLASPKVKEVLNQISIVDIADYLAHLQAYPSDVNKLVSDRSLKVNTDDNLFIEFSMVKNPVHSDNHIEALISSLNQQGTNSDSILNHMDTINKRTISQICLAKVKSRFNAYRPYSDQDLCNQFSNISVPEKKIENKQAIAQIENLLKSIDTTGSSYLKKVTSARLYQSLSSKTNAKYLTKFKTDYLDIKERKSAYLSESSDYVNSQCALFWLDEGSLSLAREFALKVKKDNSLDASSLYNAGYVLLSGGHYREAIERLELANRIDSDNSKILSCLAISKSLNGAPDKSVVRLLMQSLSLDPNQFIPRYLLGQLYFKSGKLALCLFEMNNASKVSFTDAAANVFVTAAFLKIHHYTNARKNLLQLKKKSPNSPFVKTLEYSISAREKDSSNHKKILQDLEAKYGVKLTSESIQSLNNMILEAPLPRSLPTILKTHIDKLSLDL